MVKGLIVATTKQDLFNNELAALLDKWYPEIYTVEFNDSVSFGGFCINIDIEPENQSSDANHVGTLPPIALLPCNMFEESLQMLDIVIKGKRA